MTETSSLIDRVLEASVIGSFTRIGPAVRRRIDRWDDHAEAGAGRSALVTGGNSGIGFATAVALLARGARVTVTIRDETRMAQVREALLAAATMARPDSAAVDLAGRLSILILDLDRLASVRALSERIARHDGLDVVVHNAGAMFPLRETTEDGLERTWQIHAVAPFLLTMLLVPRLATRSDARVIWVSSGGMYTERLVVRRVDSPRTYRPAVAYARAKRAQVELVRELHRRLAPSTGIAFHAMHPGWARTPGVAASLPTFDRLARPLLRSPEQGADTIVHLALAPRVPTPGDATGGGSFWGDRRPRTTDRLRRTRCDDEERAALWERLMADSGIQRPTGPV